jgi:hypothetical protein
MPLQENEHIGAWKGPEGQGSAFNICEILPLSLETLKISLVSSLRLTFIPPLPWPYPRTGLTRGARRSPCAAETGRSSI